MPVSKTLVVKYGECTPQCLTVLSKLWWLGGRYYIPF